MDVDSRAAVPNESRQYEVAETKNNQETGQGKTIAPFQQIFLDSLGHFGEDPRVIALRRAALTVAQAARSDGAVAAGQLKLRRTATTGSI